MNNKIIAFKLISWLLISLSILMNIACLFEFGHYGFITLLFRTWLLPSNAIIGILAAVMHVKFKNADVLFLLIVAVISLTLFSVADWFSPRSRSSNETIESINICKMIETIDSNSIKCLI